MGLWQIKRQIKRNHQVQKQITTQNGQILSKPDDIINEYEQHYMKLLTPKQVLSEQEKMRKIG